MPVKKVMKSKTKGVVRPKLKAKMSENPDISPEAQAGEFQKAEKRSKETLRKSNPDIGKLVMLHHH
jgi:hypothetical protein